MFGELIQIYRTGKDLGLRKSEITRTFMASGNRSLLLKVLLIVLLALLFTVVVVVIVFSSRNIYPSGTLYSSVKLKDFKNKK